ncbi:MAG: amino acid ABC transporter permease [Coriobacteriia bacterium]|nr:amino acid ABC transporter permease [Coriobacteriia bacterium]
MKQALPIVAAAFPVSLIFGFGGFLLAIPGGLTLAFMKMARYRLLRWPATVYVDVVRGTPLALQILILYFGLPFLPIYNVIAAPLSGIDVLGINATVYLRGLLILSLNSSAYLCEIFRAGIQSIPRGQMEAARSLGLSLPRSMAFVILPQTVRRILPTMMSEFILLFKDTALLASVAVMEMTLASKIIAGRVFNQSSYVVAACFYLLLTIPLGRLVSYMENRLAESEGDAA